MAAGGGWFAVYRSILKKYAGDADGLAGMIVILSWTRFESDGDLERGEVRISSRRLAEQLGWERTKARRFIKRLQRGGEIRPSNRPANRPTLGAAFYVVRYRDLQPDGKPTAPPTAPRSTPLLRKKKRRSQNGAAETLQGEGGSTAPATKGTQPRKALSLEEQRAFLRSEIGKGEGQ